MPDTPSRPARYSFPRLLLPLLGALGVAALWVFLMLYMDRTATAFAFVAAIDLVLMVRLARLPPGPMRGLVAAGGTLLAIFLATWWMLAARIALLMGMLLWEGIPLMSPSFAWTLVQLAYDGRDLAIYLAAIVLAGWWGR